jgi:prepilin-type N-terminal cleavage/methylation domain-containing protein
MRSIRHHLKAGMTLVELLVVVSILVLLSAVVLPNLAGREGGRAVQLASTNVSAQFAKAQSVAISRKGSHGIWLTPLPNNAAACVDLYSSDVPDPYRGDTFDAKFTVAPSPSWSFATLVATPSGCAASLATATFGNFANAGNLIQFNEAGPRYDFRFNTPGSPGMFAVLRPTANQTSGNSIWPAPPPAAHRFAIYRLPTRAGQPLTLPQGVAIDMAWSGVATQRFGTVVAAPGSPVLGGDGQATAPPGDDWTFDPAYQSASVVGSPATVVTMYDAAGSLAEMCYIANASSASTTRFFPQGPIYLLVGRVDRCGLPYNSAPTDDNPGANWQYRDSRWIAIDPRTGIVKVAEPLVGATVITARESQSLIRAGLTASNP